MLMVVIIGLSELLFQEMFRITIRDLAKCEHKQEVSEWMELK